MPDDVEILVYPDADGASRAAAERIAEALATAVDARGRADWATTGGSTPSRIYRHLAIPPLRDSVAWSAVHVWWCDDRFVPRDHPLSNILPVDSALIGATGLAGMSGTGVDGGDVTRGQDPGAPIPVANIHPFPTSQAIAEARDPQWCAAAYEAQLRQAGLPSEDGFPAFDLLLLGVGPDGHILSAFPGSDVFGRTEWALGVPAPTHVEPHVARVTLNPAVVTAAGRVLVTVYGAEKAGVIRAAIAEDGDPRDVPARLAKRAGATWLLDAAAARELERV
jgi:6-phosphogluconolactonase